jgi:teichuronic acid biosynthesis glycosyltransferase TuaG
MRGADLVSVIMPAHNSEAVIREAVESVRGQSYSHWELIISNDCSSDGTLAIIEALAATDKRILLVNSERQMGPAHARNSAITLASGRWLAFLDSDDYWRPDKLRETIDFARQFHSVLTFTSYQKLIEPSKKLGSVISVPTSVGYPDLLKSNEIATSTVVIDLEKCPDFKFREDVFFDDYAAWLNILKGGHRAMSLSAPLTVYRTGRKSFSSNKLRAARNVMKILKDVEKLSAPRRYWFFANYAVRGLLKFFQ